MGTKRIRRQDSEHDTEIPEAAPLEEQTKRLREFLSQAVLEHDHLRVSALKEELERQLYPRRSEQD